MVQVNCILKHPVAFEDGGMYPNQLFFTDLSQRSKNKIPSEVSILIWTLILSTIEKWGWWTSIRKISCAGQEEWETVALLFIIWGPLRLTFGELILKEWEELTQYAVQLNSRKTHYMILASALWGAGGRCSFVGSKYCMNDVASRWW